MLIAAYMLSIKKKLSLYITQTDSKVTFECENNHIIL